MKRRALHEKREELSLPLVQSKKNQNEWITKTKKAMSQKSWNIQCSFCSSFTKIKEAMSQKSLKCFTKPKIIMFVVLAALIGLVLLYFCIQSPTPTNCNFKNLQVKYPLQQDHLWATLSSGIKMILEEKTQSPSVYLFLYNKNYKTQLWPLIYNIAEETLLCVKKPSKFPFWLFGSHKEQNEKVIHLTDANFTTNIEDHGHIIEMFQTQIKSNRKVFLVVDLNELPAKAALALHAISDTASPVANDVIIFLSLYTSNTNSTKNTVGLAYNTLKSLWSDEMKDNELDALITRVIDQVLHLQS